MRQDYNGQSSNQKAELTEIQYKRGTILSSARTLTPRLLIYAEGQLASCADWLRSQTVANCRQVSGHDTSPIQKIDKTMGSKAPWSRAYERTRKNPLGKTRSWGVSVPLWVSLFDHGSGYRRENCSTIQLQGVTKCRQSREEREAAKKYISQQSNRNRN